MSRPRGLALPPHVRIAATVAFTLGVVATPRTTLWVHVVHALVIAVVAWLSHVGPATLGRGLLVEVPFVVFAALLPFIALGPRVAVGPFLVSAAGLSAAASMLCKATLGVAAATVLAATTRPDQIVHGLETLRLPRLLVQILSFMVRYVHVVADDAGRMRVALASRGFRATSPRHWGVVTASLGALFIRTYERGERVHLAMLSRGYTGVLPTEPAPKATYAQWAVGGIGPLVAWLATAAGRMSA